MGIYATVAQLRAEPEVPDADPPSDATLEGWIAQAEDQIDEWLGAWPVQPDGRKIVQVDTEAWRWDKISRATVRLAARLFANPNVLAAARYTSISGPDFSKSGPAPALRQLGDVTAPLNASGLRILGARATA